MCSGLFSRSFLGRCLLCCNFLSCNFLGRCFLRSRLLSGSFLGCFFRRSLLGDSLLGRLLCYFFTWHAAHPMLFSLRNQLCHAWFRLTVVIPCRKSALKRRSPREHAGRFALKGRGRTSRCELIKRYCPHHGGQYKAGGTANCAQFVPPRVLYFLGDFLCHHHFALSAPRLICPQWSTQS